MTPTPRWRLGATPADEVGPEHVGRRASIRRWVDDDGHQRPSDVVGIVLAYDPDGDVSVERRDGRVDTFAAADIIASRLVPDPPPRRRPRD